MDKFLSVTHFSSEETATYEGGVVGRGYVALEAQRPGLLTLLFSLCPARISLCTV